MVARSVGGNNHAGIGMTSARTRDRLIERLRAQGIRHDGVLARMRDLPRHLFVDEALASRAYEDTALPIGYSQTISQPFIVALMTAALVDGLEPGKKLPSVLEIGTGCGYQTAVLAPFVRHVYSIERIFPLVKRAQETLREIRVNNVSVRFGDGFLGWRSQGPFQGILVAAAPTALPQALLDQLDDGGRLVIPVGTIGCQELLRITRRGDEWQREVLSAVSFVPLVQGTST